MQRTLALTLVAFAGCTAVQPADIAVASYPAAFLAEGLAGDDLRVVDLAAGGLHGFEPRARDLDQLRQSTHLVLWDDALESWAHRAQRSLGDAAPTVVAISRLPPGEAYLGGGPTHDDHDHDGDDGHDPHTWTDPLAMAASLAALEEHLAAAYPEHAPAIAARAAALHARLTDLDAAFRDGLTDCRHTSVITNHEAHAYLARRYGFDLLTLHGIEPGSEPTPAHVQEVIDTIRDHGIPVIFIEEGTDADALRAIQDETGVAVRVLHTLETRPAGDYISAQHENLQELRRAMECP